MSKAKASSAARRSDLQPRILKLLRDELSARPEEIAEKLFPSISRDPKELAVKTRLVKKVLPAYLRVAGWQRRNMWVTEGGLNPELFVRLSVSEEKGRKVIGGRSDACQCVVSSDGSMKVRVYRPSWRGWLIQQLVNCGWSVETAEKHVMNLHCDLKTAELRLDMSSILKKLKEFAVGDTETGIRVLLGRRRLVLEISPELAMLVQNSWDNEDEMLSRLRSSESNQVVLASVSALRIDKVLQGLGLNPQQARQASDTLVTLGVEDQRPDFVCLVYGPPSAKPKQVGIRALITPLTNYEIRLSHR